MKFSSSFFMKDDTESDAAAYIPVFLDALKHMYACKAQASVYEHNSNMYELLFTMIDRRCLQCIPDTMYRLNIY